MHLFERKIDSAFFEKICKKGDSAEWLKRTALARIRQVMMTKHL